MNPNADYLGIVTLLRGLRERGLVSGSEAKKIAARLMVYLDDGSGGSPWRYSVTTDQYVNSGDFHSVTEAEATAVMDKYTHETLAFAPFVV